MPLFRTDAFYTAELLRAHPDTFFVFGDNNLRRGHGGQAAIRDEPNAVGLSTKWGPGNHPEAFYDEDDGHLMAPDIIKVLQLSLNHNVVVPFTDRVQLGTGLSELPQRAPSLYAVLSLIFTDALPIFP